MKQSSSKSLEKKLTRKMADLDAAMESRQQIDSKIKELREAIENLQSTQLEQVFQQVKKSILKEGLRVDADSVPGILQSIRESQEKDVPSGQESTSTKEDDENLTQNAPANPEDGSYFPKEEENGLDVPAYNGSRLP